MKKSLILLFLLFSSIGVYADDMTKEANEVASDFAKKRAKLNTTIDFAGFFGDDEELKLDETNQKFLTNIETCTKNDIPVLIKEKKYKIIGITNDGKCQIDFSTDKKNGKCFFEKNNLSDISKYFGKVLTKTDAKKINFDFDMKMPEIKFSDISDEDLDFNFKMNMPKIKVKKVETEIEKIIDEACEK